jgi:hypothetical protein
MCCASRDAAREREHLHAPRRGGLGATTLLRGRRARALSSRALVPLSQLPPGELAAAGASRRLVGPCNVTWQCRRRVRSGARASARRRRRIGDAGPAQRWSIRHVLLPWRRIRPRAEPPIVSVGARELSSASAACPLERRLPFATTRYRRSRNCARPCSRESSRAAPSRSSDQKRAARTASGDSAPLRLSTRRGTPRLLELIARGAISS